MIVLLGKNGSGKTYLASYLKEKGYNYTPNYTTRPKRVGEVDGIDYIFIDETEFKKLVKDGFFVEYKEFAGCYYGTPITKLSDNSITIAGNIDTLNKESSSPINIVYIHSNIAKRFERIKNRNQSNDILFNRMHLENFDYLNNFKSFFIDNSYDQGTMMITDIISVDGSIKSTQMLSNHQFLKMQSYSYSDDDSQLLNFLKFEEQLLITIAISDSNMSKKEMYKRYQCLLDEYCRNVGISISFNHDMSFNVTCDNETYKGKYLEKKLGDIRL